MFAVAGKGVIARTSDDDCMNVRRLGESFGFALAFVFVPTLGGRHERATARGAKFRTIEEAIRSPGAMRKNDERQKATRKGAEGCGC